jgi:hypothetical protein
MKSIALSVLAIFMVAALFASVSRPDAAGASYYYNYYFASGLEAWTEGQATEGGPGEALQLATESNGNSHALLSDDSEDTAWMLASFGGREERVRVKFEARNVDGCESCEPLLYIGNSKPTGREQFRSVGTALGPSWQTYVLDVPVKAETVVVAIGYKSAQAGRMGVDNISVKRYSR